MSSSSAHCLFVVSIACAAQAEQVTKPVLMRLAARYLLKERRRGLSLVRLHAIRNLVVFMLPTRFLCWHMHVLDPCANILAWHAELTRMPCQDPVANFHLRNGASIAHLQWGADPSARGKAGSFGIMVNYQCALLSLLSGSICWLDAHYLADTAEGLPLLILHLENELEQAITVLQVCSG